MHKHARGIFTAVDLRDGCFGTTTVMRIVSMFVPDNIFKATAPGGQRIALQHPFEPAVLAAIEAPPEESGRTGHSRLSTEAVMAAEHAAPGASEQFADPAQGASTDVDWVDVASDLPTRGSVVASAGSQAFEQPLPPSASLSDTVHLPLPAGIADSQPQPAPAEDIKEWLNTRCLRTALLRLHLLQTALQGTLERWGRLSRRLVPAQSPQSLWHRRRPPTLRRAQPQQPAWTTTASQALLPSL